MNLYEAMNKGLEKKYNLNEAQWKEVVNSKNYNGARASIVAVADKRYTLDELKQTYSDINPSLYQFNERGNKAFLDDNRDEIKNVWRDNNANYLYLGRAIRIEDDGKKHPYYFYD